MSENVYVPQVGDEVLVQREGTVTGIGACSGEVYYTTKGGRNGWCLPSEVTLVSRPMPPLPTEPTPILATVRGVEDVLLVGPDEYGQWASAVDVVDHSGEGFSWHQPEHITAWRVWTPEDAA